MDTVTQAVLGATVGQAVGGRRLGRRAAWWGAAAGSLPDLDVLARTVVGPFGSLEWHRGPTHALWFGPVVGTLLGLLAWRAYRDRKPPAHAPPPDSAADRRAWIAVWVLGLLTHPLLDLFTSYGTQLLSPFDHTRFAINGVGIIDPAYTGVLIVALIIGRVWRRRPAIGARAAWVGLALTTGYLFYGVAQNDRAIDLATTQLAAEGVRPDRVDAYPTLFQPYLRRVVAWTPDAVRVGWISTWQPAPIEWTLVPRVHDPRVDALRATRRGRLFAWFADHRLVGKVEPAADGGATVELHDFRYGMPYAPDRSMWGIRAHFDAAGDRDGPIERFRNPRPDDTSGAIRQLMQMAFAPAR